MRTNVRIGNDIKLLWEVLRGGYPVNFNNATEIKVSILQGGKYSCEDKTEISTFEIDSEQSNLLNIEIQADKITELGYLWVVLEYTMGDQGMVDGNRKITIDNLPVKIVGLSDEAGQVFEFEMTSDVVVGFDGKSAFEVWLVENPDKTLQDYFDWLQQPATDIAEDVSQAEALRVQAETLRVQAENIRLANEQTRVTAEQGRVSAENIRTSSEVDRVNAENIRLSNEQSRIDVEVLRDSAEQQRLLDEATRVSNEETRVTNESGRVTAEQGRVDAEIIREQQEADRQTNTATAIDNAEEATINANDSADAANTAATTIDAKIATKAEQADLDQLAVDVEDTTEKAGAASLAELNARLLTLEKIVSATITNKLEVTKEFNVWGKTNLILIGSGAATFAPDFVGQKYIDTAGGNVYVAVGVATAGNWKLV